MSIDFAFHVRKICEAAENAHRADFDDSTNRDENGKLTYSRAPTRASMFLALAWIKQVNAEAEASLSEADPKIKRAGIKAQELEGDGAQHICYPFEVPTVRTLGFGIFTKKFPALDLMLVQAKPAWLLRLELMQQLSEMVMEGEIITKDSAP